jgi:hypothetical protein
MGVNYHAIHFLSFVKEKYGDFGFSITLGRQNLLLDQKTQKKFGIYNLRFLDEVPATIFNSKTMDSIDFSDYEGANILHDLNLPVKDSLVEQYDTLIDLGTTEHIFNVPQALDNCVKLIKVGGKSFIFYLLIIIMGTVSISFLLNYSIHTILKPMDFIPKFSWPKQMDLNIG